MKKQIKLYIEAELRDYHQTKREYEELRDNLLNLSPGPPDGMPRGSEVSNPTYQRTARLLTNRRIKYMEMVLKGIGMVLGEIGEERLRLVELKYWQRPRQLTDAGIAQRMNIDRRTVYKWTDSICLAVAIELGLINEVGHNMGTIGG